LLLLVPCRQARDVRALPLALLSIPLQLGFPVAPSLLLFLPQSLTLGGLGEPALPLQFGRLPSLGDPGRGSPLGPAGGQLAAGVNDEDDGSEKRYPPQRLTPVKRRLGGLLRRVLRVVVPRRPLAALVVEI